MKFDIDKSIDILNRTPYVLEAMLEDLSSEWLHNNEGGDSWSPYTILGHLIHGEKTDWIPRARVILSGEDNKPFIPFDRFAQLEKDQDVPIAELLLEFRDLRSKNIEELKAMNLNEDKLSMTGVHPELGEVQLKELISTWTVHDLGHISQISRVMASQYSSEVGPWSQYLTILHKVQ